MTEKWLQGFAYRIRLGVGPFLLASGFALLVALATVSYQSVKAALAIPSTPSGTSRNARPGSRNEFISHIFGNGIQRKEADMKDTKRLSKLLGILLFCYPLAAQDARFSGRWVLNREKTQMPNLPESR